MKRMIRNSTNQQVKASYPQDQLKEMRKAKEVISKFSPEQVKYVEEAYADCIADYTSPYSFSRARLEWAASAAEDEIFDNDDDFYVLFDAVETSHMDDAIAWS